VSNGDDDSKSVNDTNTFSYSEQNNMTDKPCLGNNYNNPSPHRFATRAPFGLGRFHEKLSEKKHSKSIFSFSQENARPTTLGLTVGSKKDPGYNQKTFMLHTRCTIITHTVLVRSYLVTLLHTIHY
jgi:hypothetical protein